MDRRSITSTIQNARDAGCQCRFTIAAYCAGRHGITLDEALQHVSAVHMHLTQLPGNECLLTIDPISQSCAMQYDKHIVMCDCSGSMFIPGVGGVTYADQVRNMLPSLINGLPMGCYFECMTFGDAVERVESSFVTPATRRRLLNQCSDWISDEAHGRSTDGYGALLAAIRASDGNRSHIIFITDGQFNNATTFGPGHMNMHTIKDRLDPLLASNDVNITSICLGRDAELMGIISNNTVFCDDSTELSTTVEKVMRYASGVVAGSIEITVDTNSGPRPYFLAQKLPACTTDPSLSCVVHPSLTAVTPDARSMTGIAKYIDERAVSEAAELGFTWRGSYLVSKDANDNLCPVADMMGVSNIYRHTDTLCYGSPLHFIVRMSRANSVTVRLEDCSAMIGCPCAVLHGYEAIDATPATENIAKIHRWNCWLAYMYDCMEGITMDELTAISALAPTTQHKNQIMRHRSLLQRNDRRMSAHYRSMHLSEIRLQRSVHTPLS